MSHIDNQDFFTLKQPELSDWQCYLFGSDGGGITWTPFKGKEPN